MQLLQHFHELTLHLANAKELKALILQLAVQGKLTAEWRKANPGVEPAEKLLERVKAEKERLIKEKKIKKEKPLPKINDEEIPFELPENWSWCHVGDVGRTNIGLTYSPTEITDDGVIVLRSSNIKNGELSFDDIVKVKKELKENVLVKDGDLLICARNGSRKLVGKCALIKPFKGEMAFGAFMALLRSPFNSFIKLFIESPIYRISLEGVETTTINQITQSNLKETKIPLPPLEEQKAIVAVVEQLFKEVEQLEQLTETRIRLKEQFALSALRDLTANDTPQEWEALQPRFHTFFNETANIKKLRETILQLAVQGKLTARWRKANSPFEGGNGHPDDHDAALLLQKIKTEKARLIAQGKIKKENPLPEITADEKPYELPEGWVWCRFDSLNRNIHYGFTASALNTYSGIRMLRITDIQNNTVNWETVPDCTITENEYQKFKLEENDILIARTGGTIGKSYQVKDIIVNSVFASYLIRAIPVSNIKAAFAKLLIETPLYWQQLVKLSMGTGQPNVNATSLKSLVFPLPPLPEQKSIVETVNRLMALCDRLEQECTQSKAQAEQWMKGVVREVLEKEY
jgi:type I restriction enzyme, S subunit